jgi:NAD+ synthase (glutamine-hydrolysing)
MPARKASPAEVRELHGFVRVAAVSPELVLGDPLKNAGIIAAEAARLAAEGTRVIVFPELSLTGYTCGDLFHSNVLRSQAVEGLSQLVSASAEIEALIVVGLPLLVQGRLYNVAAVVSGGEVLGFVPKSFLPNSAEFYERRWFSPAHTLDVREIGAPIGTDLLFEVANVPGCVVGIEICEDLWTVNPPSGRLALAGATIIVNPSASTELLGKAPYRRNLVAQQSARCLAAYVYAGAGAGESSTDVVYSGHGLIAENGVILDETERFSFDSRSVTADIDIQNLTHERIRSAAFRDERSRSSRARFHAASRLHRRRTTRCAGRSRRIPSCLRPKWIVRRLRGDFRHSSTGLARRLKQAAPRPP